MAEPELKEYQTAAERIRAAAGRGMLSHALLLTGTGDRAAAAQFAAAAMECTAPGEKPCGVCAGCRKVFQGIHPDVTMVRDAEHKNLAVDVVRGVRTDAYIRPNEGARKVYIFEDCSLLTDQDQNVLLKVVEEGPPYAAFCFCAENPSAVLPTLRSRCVEIRLRPEDETQTPADDSAQALYRAVAGLRRGAVTELAVRLEKQKTSREELQALLEQACALFARSLLCLYGCSGDELSKESTSFPVKNLTKTQIMHTIEILQKYRRECAYNVGPNHVLGALAVELEGIL